MKRLSDRPFRAGHRTVTLFIMIGVAITGCGDSDGLPRQPISGKVSLDGQPLDKAWIEFRPDGEGGITVAGAMIQEGGYHVPRQDGLIPGKYRIAISKPELDKDRLTPLRLKPLRKGAAKPNVEADPYAPRMMAKQLIPARYNTKSSLVEEVKADQPNDFNFELTSK
jgi:hypothetical protein